MDTRNLLDKRHRARGAAKPLVVAIIVVLAVLVIGAWFLIIKPHQEMMLEDAGGHPSGPALASTGKTPPPADVASMDVNQLLGEARKAINEQRYLAPVGNNAFEFYLRVLQKQPSNQVASDALRETFPYAATSAEQVINARDFDESQRQIDLLAKADPANFTLTILRSKLDAQRKLLDKQQQQVVDQQKAQQVAAQKAASEKAEADKLAEQQKIQAAEAAQLKARQARATPQPAQQVAAVKPAAGDAGDSAGIGNSGKNSEAILVKGAEPIYPQIALRAHQSGWAVVAFTIDPNGRTNDIHVTSSQPKHVFERAAIDAVARYRFTPAMKNGEAVPSAREQRIEFNL
ncbi:energy transducer TonB [Rhodanobacter sp. MP1X3]|uniref:energy transducer TonB n=1 Tax=Rhodanobacter sp. MP1X3 TaxID=2723086 RepID=UPI001608404E|nr:energy transducer TonB [Rhodanobacter sp. MP1X3]MBB6242699.1 protein TonB [Rhodanobacter sp. MP1X3]